MKRKVRFMEGVEQIVVLGLIVLFVFGALARKRAPDAGDTHGSASWETEEGLEKAGKVGRKKGRPVGRTAESGRLIRLDDGCHWAVYGSTGSGKGVSYLIPALLSYRDGAVFCFDPDGDSAKKVAPALRRAGVNVVVMDPFLSLGDKTAFYNPLADVQVGPYLVDDARALANALVLRTGNETEPHFLDYAEIELTALLTCALIEAPPELRTLKAIAAISADNDKRKQAIELLKKRGGVPQLLGNQMSIPTGDEASSVRSTLQRQLSFVASPLVEAFLEKSSFSADVLLEPGTVVFYVVPGRLVDSTRNLSRFLVAGLLRHVMQHGTPHPALFLLDETACLGRLDSLGTALVQGRKKGVRLLTSWQGIEQAQAAFPETPNLVMANSDTRVFIGGGVNDHATADLVSKMCGNATISVVSTNDGRSRSWQEGGAQGGQHSASDGTTRSSKERALLYPDEVLTLDKRLSVVFHTGLRPLLARRLFYYGDPLFANILSGKRGDR